MPKGGGKRAKREPVKAIKDEEPEAALDVEFPVHAEDGYEVPLVCRDASEYYSVMGVLFWSHYNSLEAGIMRFFDTKEACVLRLVHSEFRDAVSATPWHDLRTVIKGSVAQWRECFGLRAQAARVFKRKDLVDSDFVYFRGLAALDMSNTAGFSVAACANLRGISCLKMDHCAISVGAISLLKGIQEISMWECNNAVVTAASEMLQGVRSMLLNSEQNLLSIAIAARDVPECRRLLATRAIGSACWLYAGVSFRDVAAPSTSERVIASACMELLQVGIELESEGIICEAAGAVIGFTFTESEARIGCCLALGVVAALVAALNVRVCWMDESACANVCAALNSFARKDEGREACLNAEAIPTLVALLKFHLDSPFVSQYLCGALWSMSCSQAGTTDCISSSGVPQIVAALRIHDEHEDVCLQASGALRAIASFADGVTACLSADAVPYLLAASEKHLRAREVAKIALKNLGVDVD